MPLKYGREDYAVVTNMDTLDVADYVVQDVNRFQAVVFGDDRYLETDGEDGTPPEIPRERSTWWHFDEVSTHMDARTYGYEGPDQYLPLVSGL